ncbi:MFS transporter [Sphingobium sp. BYY-5]|uniref:MFS transporter n=1 Tax=Sphingobium sp. BYY-5 TaxID=2926400 RepID=UPI001FA78DE8|nr:MFS transporter [Sphingobium sp. BYY-5]MCI4592272.1 MFS transporter [Sphingobium sp. BYY-5]
MTMELTRALPEKILPRHQEWQAVVYVRQSTMRQVVENRPACADRACGLAWSLLAGYARLMVSVRQQAKAMAIAMVGTPIALSLDVPLGTWFGSLIGWRTAFWIMSLLTLILIIWILVKAANYPGQKKGERMPLLRIFSTPGVRPVLNMVVA